MRGIMILADRHYVTSSNVQRSDDGYHADLPVGGTVFVPAGQLLAFELYQTDSEIEFAFRSRCRELESERAEALRAGADQ